MCTFLPDEQEAMTALAQQAAKLSSLSDKGVGHSESIFTTHGCDIKTLSILLD